MQYCIKKSSQKPCNNTKNKTTINSDKIYLNSFNQKVFDTLKNKKRSNCSNF